VPHHHVGRRSLFRRGRLVAAGTPEAVVAAGLVDALSAPGPLSVFAPTNDGFAALLAELGISKAALLADYRVSRVTSSVASTLGDVVRVQAGVVAIDGGAVEDIAIPMSTQPLGA
jgi:hypothetical protein